MPEVLDSPKPSSTADFYQLIHEQISNEDSSMNQRVNWLIVPQSFFFSGFATFDSKDTLNYRYMKRCITV
jgi:hypothetical protein